MFKKLAFVVTVAAYLLLGCKLLWADNEIAYKTVAMEASNQSDYGQYLVASVIVNRAHGKSLDVVCLSKRQFSCWNSPKWARTWLETYYSLSTHQRAVIALERAIRSPYHGITHYHTLGVHPKWAIGHKPVVIEGSHAFYSDID